MNIKVTILLRPIFLLLLLTSFFHVHAQQICWNVTDSLYFQLEDETTPASGYSFAETKPSTKGNVQIIFPTGTCGYSSNTTGPLDWSQYVIVNNPADIDATNYADISPGAGNLLMLTRCETSSNDMDFPHLEFINLKPNTVYTISFDIVNPILNSSTECKPSSFGIQYSIFRNARGTYMNMISGGNSNYTSPAYGGGATTVTLSFNPSANGNGNPTKALIYFSQLNNLNKSCAPVALRNIQISYQPCTSLKVSNTNICPGEAVTLSLENYEGEESEFIWEYKRSGDTDFTMLDTTSDPEITVYPTETTEYRLTVGTQTVSTTVNVLTQLECFRINAHYSSLICLGDSNVLIASGKRAVENLDATNYIWEEYDEETSSWLTLSSTTIKQTIVPKKEGDTRYRVTLGTLQDEYTQKTQTCKDTVCQGLDSKVVFHETFGFFMSENIYVDSKDNIWRNSITRNSKTFNIENYWSADPNGYVVEASSLGAFDGHLYALEDPRISTCPSSVTDNFCWCPLKVNGKGYRIEDGYYAILKDPDLSNCGNDAGGEYDYWSGPDHTGNDNGGMLFVNCGSTPGALIYSQKVKVNCAYSQFNFSAFISNAVQRSSSTTPVNLTFKILAADSSTVLRSYNSENVPRNPGVWYYQSTQFENTGGDTEFFVQLINNGASGNGNDILLDDIVFSVCVPKVTLVTEGMDLSDEVEEISVCKDSTIILKAVQEVKLINNPLHLFQYRKAGEQTWIDISGRDASSYAKDTIHIHTGESRFMGDIEYRVVIAATEEILLKFAEGRVDELSECDAYNLAYSFFKITNKYGGKMCPDELLKPCIEEEFEITGCREGEDSAGWNHTWQWEWKTKRGLIIPGYEKSNIPATKEDSLKRTLPVQYNVIPATLDTLYFYGYDEGGCFQYQKFIIDVQPKASFDVPTDLQTGCDSVIIKAENIAAGAGVLWTISGITTPDGIYEVRGDSVIIKSTTLPVTGKVKAEIDPLTLQYCLRDPIEIPFRIMAGESLSVSLKADGDIDALCLNPAETDSIILRATVTPAESADDIEEYFWYLDGTLLDTTTEDSLVISTDPAGKYPGILVPGAKLNFEVRVADGVCFDSNNLSAPGSFYFEVNEPYRLELEVAPNDTICLSGDGSGAPVEMILTATAKSLANPANTDVARNIKQYIWMVYDADLAADVPFDTTSTNVHTISLTNPPALLAKYIDAGTSLLFGVTAIDSVCYNEMNDETKGNILITLNEKYTMTISRSEEIICISNDGTMQDDTELTKLFVSITPANAKKHIKEYNWYLNNTLFRTTQDTVLVLTYADLKDKQGDDLTFKVSSFDGICIESNAPEESSNIDLKIRTSDVSLVLLADRNDLCIDPLDADNNKISLSAVVTPSSASRNITEYIWLADGVELETTTDSTLVVSQATYPDLFIAGKTVTFNVRIFDANCNNDFIEGTGTGESVLVNESYQMELITKDNQSVVCSDGDNNTIELIARVTPEEAKNHIKEYIWYANGNEIKRTADTVLVINQTDFATLFVPGETVSFLVKSYDDICYSDGAPAESNNLGIQFNEKYSMTLSANGQDAICVDSDNSSITLSALISPEKAKAHILEYIWMVDGVEFARTPDSELVIDQASYPAIVIVGNTPVFSVKSYDDICYTDNDPAASGNVSVRINESYQTELRTKDNELVICSDSDNNTIELIARITPEEAKNQIKEYIWYANGNEIKRTTDTTLVINQSSFPALFVSGETVSFQVKSYDDVCYTSGAPAQSNNIEVQFNEKYSMTLSANGQDAICVDSDNSSITLTALISPEKAKAHILEYIWMVDGVEFARTPDSELVIDQASYPAIVIVGNTPVFSVKSYDDICYTNNDPAASGNVSVRINESYQTTLSTKDNQLVICSDGDNNTIELIATITPEEAKNQIKEYIWYANGSEIKRTTSTTLTVDRASFPALFVSGETVSFQVQSYDDVCYTSGAPAQSNNVPVQFNEKYSMKLSTDGQSVLCTDSDNSSVTLTAVVTPAQSKNHIIEYIWMADGVEFARTQESELIVDQVSFPNVIIIGTTPVFSVKSYDDICYTDSDPAASDEIEVKINGHFDMKITPDKNSFCSENDMLVLTVDIIPEISGTMIKEYYWYKIKENDTNEISLGKTDSPRFEVGNSPAGKYYFYVKAIDDICYTISGPAVSDQAEIVINETLRADLVADQYQVCEEGSVILSALTLQGTPTRYEFYDRDGNLTHTVNAPNGETKVSIESLPVEDANGYTVRVYDDVCSDDYASAAVAGVGSIDIYEPIDFEIEVLNPDICLGDTTRLKLTLLQGRPSVYTWYNIGRDNKEQTIKIYSTDVPSMNEYELADAPVSFGYKEYKVVASDGVCPDKTVSYQNMVSIKEPVSIKLSTDKQKVLIGTEVKLLVEVLTGDPFIYTWWENESLIEENGSTEHTVEPKSSSKYTVFASDEICPQASASIEVEVKLPTAFTPYDKEGYNDYFMKGFEVVIFNRYGQRVFSGNDGWDGTYRGKLADPGVYFYTVTMKDGKVEKGTIEIVKM